jgi:NAD kinase
MYEKLVIVTRKTRLQELIERFNTRGQAKFYIEQAGGNFGEYEREDAEYCAAFELLRKSLEFELKLQAIDREFLPTFQFMPQDVVITLGQDGLVANTAKYVKGQPIIAVNSNPGIFDGILLPYVPAGARKAVSSVLEGKANMREVTMAEAVLNDGQKILAFNDLFIGPCTHVSARYQISWHDKSESQSSSGVLVSTGAGSTGWLSSVFNMARGLAGLTGGKTGKEVRLPWQDPRLLFVVREPFVSRHSTAEIVAGLVAPGQQLTMESLMPSGGVIFSDGIEADYLNFNSGAVVQVKAAHQKARLVVDKAA